MAMVSFTFSKGCTSEEDKTENQKVLQDIEQKRVELCYQLLKDNEISKVQQGVPSLTVKQLAYLLDYRVLYFVISLATDKAYFGHDWLEQLEVTTKNFLKTASQDKELLDYYPSSEGRLRSHYSCRLPAYPQYMYKNILEFYRRTLKPNVFEIGLRLSTFSREGEHPFEVSPIIFKFVLHYNGKLKSDNPKESLKYQPLPTWCTTAVRPRRVYRENFEAGCTIQ